MTADKPEGEQADVEADEAWIRMSGGEMSIRVRNLTRYLEKGGVILSARLVEGVDGLWRLWLQLADRPGDFLLNQFHADEPKTFRDVSLAIASVRREMGFYGEIAVLTDRRGAPAPRKRR